MLNVTSEVFEIELHINQGLLSFKDIAEVTHTSIEYVQLVHKQMMERDY